MIYIGSLTKLYKMYAFFWDDPRIMNKFNRYPSYPHITRVGTVYALLYTAKCKLPQFMLYEYNLGTYSMHSLSITM